VTAGLELTGTLENAMQRMGLVAREPGGEHALKGPR